jgi:hypothetical protein
MPAQHLNETAEFGELLKEFTPHKLIRKEIKKQNYFLENIRREKWVDGQPLKMAFEHGKRSSVRSGGLVASNKITQGKYKTATMTEHKFLSMALKFLERDLKKHGDLRTSFIKLLPNEIKESSVRMNYLFNLLMFDKGRVVQFVGESTAKASGWVKVNKPQRLEIGERLEVNLDVNPAVAGFEAYVAEVDMNKKEVKLTSDAGLTSPIDMSVYVFSDEEASKRSGLYVVGWDSANGFTSILDLVFDAGTGGSDTLYEGQIIKKSAPVHQSILTDASSWTSANIVSNLIDFYYDTEALGQVGKREGLCGYGFFKEVAKKLESQKRYTGNFRQGTMGMSQLEVIGSGKPMILTAIEQMPEDRAMILPFEDFCLATDQFVEPHKDLNGNMYHIERVAGGTGNDGYEAVHDIMCSGEIYAKRLSQTAGIHGLSL